jgi:hypothetical protein
MGDKRLAAYMLFAIFSFLYLAKDAGIIVSPRRL